MSQDFEYQIGIEEYEVDGPVYEGMPDGVGYWFVPEEKLPSKARFPGAQMTAAGTFTSEPRNIQEEIGEDVARHEFECRSGSDLSADSPDRYNFDIRELRIESGLPDHAGISVLVSDIPERIREAEEPWYLTLEIRYDRERSLAGRSPASIAQVRGDIDNTTPGVNIETYFYPENVSSVSSFQVQDGILYADVQLRSRTKAVLAWDVSNSRQLWITERDVTDWAGSTLSNRILMTESTVCLVLDSGGLLTFDAATGAQRWTQPSVVEDWIVLASETLVVGSEESIQGIEAVTGTTQWTAERPATLCGLTATDERVIIAQEDGLTARAAATGSVEWRADIEPIPPTDPDTGVGRNREGSLEYWMTHGPILWGIGTAGETAVVATKENVLVALDTDTGTQRWRTDYEGDLAWVAPSESVVAVGTDDAPVQGFDTVTGKCRWRADIGLRQTVELGAETIYTANDHGKVWAYSLATGTLAWRYEPKWRTWPPGPPQLMIAAGDRLWLHTVDTELAAEPKGYQFEVLRPTGSTQRQFEGVVVDLDDRLARISLDDGDDSYLLVPRDRLPWYGDFEQAHYHVVIGTASEYEAVSGERQRASAQITEFELTVEDRDADTVRLSLTPLDEELPEGSAVIPADGLAEDCRDPGATGYASIHLIYNEDTTPNEAIPEEYQ